MMSPQGDENVCFDICHETTREEESTGYLGLCVHVFGDLVYNGVWHQILDKPKRSAIC